MRAVLYVRVSDARQADNTSLDAQEQFCRQWCETNGVQVDRVFKEAGASAKSVNRPEFQRMFLWLEQNHSAISHLVCDKWDRFSRSLEDGVTYRMQLKAWHVELVSATQPVTDDPAGNLMRNVLQSFAQFDNEQRAERSLRGMRDAAKSGRFVNPAPVGYKNAGNKSGPSLVQDESAPLVRGMFERVAAGDGVADALAWARLQGLRGKYGARITVQTASRLLRTHTYAARLEMPKWGISMKGDWEPIVELETWSKVQSILDGKSHALRVPHTAVNDSYQLRGLILCSTCGKPATASTSRGKLGGRFAYYHCPRGRGHLSIRVDKADALFVRLLESLIPNAARLELFRECFREVWNLKNGSAASDRDRLQTELTKLQQRKRRTFSLVQDGTISSEEFRPEWDSLNGQIAAIETALTQAQEHLDCDTALGYLEHLMFNQHALWFESNTEQKRRMARSIFPSGIRCSKEGLGTPPTHSIFSMLGDENVSQENLVALTGIEPVF